MKVMTGGTKESNSSEHPPLEIAIEQRGARDVPSAKNGVAVLEIICHLQRSFWTLSQLESDYSSAPAHI